MKGVIETTEFHEKLAVMLHALENYTPEPEETALVTTLIDDLKGELCMVTK